MTEEIVKILSVDAGDSNTSVKQLRKEIKLLKDELLNLDESSQDYNKVLGALADRTFAMRDMNELVRYSAADLGEQIATVNRIATGLASGFGAVQGAMALFGSESETVEKTMVRLQGVIALVQGLQGLEGLSKDLKAASIQFRNATTAVKTFIGGLSGIQKALIATGIGAFIAAIGALTAAYISNSKEADRYAAILDKIDEKQQKISDRNNKNIAAVEREIKLLKEQGTAEDELLDKRLKAYQAAQDDQYNQLKAAERQLEDAKRRQKEEFASGVSDEDIQRLEEQVAEARKIYENYGEKIKDILLDIELATIRSNKKIEEDNQKKIEKAIELANKEKEEINKELESIDSRIHKNVTDEITLRTEQFNQEKALFEKNGKDITDLQKEYDADIAKLQAEAAQEKLDKIKETSNKIVEELNNSISNIQQSSSNKIDTINLNYNSAGISKDPQKAYENEVAYNNAIFQAKSEAINQENSLLLAQLNNEQLTADARKEIQQQLFVNNIELSNLELETKKKNTEAEVSLEKKKQQAKQATLSVASSVFGSMASLLGETTTAGKIAAVAQATIDTYSAANSAYAAMAGIPIVGPALGAAAAAAAIIAGLANVKSILSVDTESANSSSISSSYSSPSMDIGRSLPVEYTRNLLSDTETEELNSSQRVYVLESDITSTQNKVSVVENNATF